MTLELHLRRPVVDDHVWPDIATVPRSLRARAAAPLTMALLRRAAERAHVRVEIATDVAGQIDGPVMLIADPEAFARRVGSCGLIGLGESYMAGEWDSPDLVGVLTRLAGVISTAVPAPLQRLRSIHLPPVPDVDDPRTSHAARSNIARHYDLSNEFFAGFLDDTMTYSAALFDDPDTAGWNDLASAQAAKIDRLLDRAGVGHGTRLLEIGTGWGELAIRAAARGARVHSVTLSGEQLHAARARVAAAGLTDSVDITLTDYRDITGRYDAAVSVEMIEAVGYAHWPTYFGRLAELVRPGGQIALQAITMPHDRMLASRNTYTWIQKYIFPGGLLPSTEAVLAHAWVAGLHVTDRMSLAPHYAATLRLWRRRFGTVGAAALPPGADDVFIRMWNFYLAYSEAGFRSAYLDVEQFAFRVGGPQ
ncbi:methyltransferase domain-containing protein [Gordonia sp. TBRC 11910]|uniref:Methyltransferase domain-containing protein n=1 Tax=Gordonia asplenii TaxID=2725283 RepID=A0A848KTD3_9ACTN|nr:class I SAM-dependent methyltransferase [Gordonia asplenii]NMO01956.1 methyltransferase domain-containing protein [Gordonia asplenii]